ncbi:hypothetical protein [Micrococcus terreus]
MIDFFCEVFDDVVGAGVPSNEALGETLQEALEFFVEPWSFEGGDD